MKVYTKAYYAAHSEKARAASKAWGIANPEKKKEQNASRDKADIREAARLYRQKNRDKVLRGYAAYALKYPHKRAEKEARRRGSIRVPKWANRFFIEEIYDLAQRRTKATGFEWSVDHIVPVRHPLVCGLHCEQNLRVIPAVLNSAKGNRIWPDMS